MNKIILRTLVFAILLFGCNADKAKTIIGIKQVNCQSPTDAIVKFKELKENDVSLAILNYAKSKNIEFSNLEEKEISDWINNTVFSAQRSYSGIKEWNINDDDICFVQNIKIESASDSTQVSEVDIKICNSILTKDVSAGNYWEFDFENFVIHLTYCFDAIEFIKPVGYYEILDKNGQMERSLKTNLRKHNCVVHINLTFIDKKRNTEFHKQILSDMDFYIPILETGENYKQHWIQSITSS
ncbi:hypothetical protein [Mangrovimonas sp. DI 80]|uniref:hypothetical protein n=1 Tax=Mangrovimonas sp. DI 80 TaxID=1779330 RepID=UPI000975C2FE|nr:hypothetical protein [Mangrovimonas sp. DI 80]OMP30474.1 hypothetical protein BKM32_13955 [Mangrovimonas sp. DI 80]